MDNFLTKKSDNQIPISVVIPSFNSKQWLAQAIESVNRGKKPADIIVVDDCSTDDSYGFAISLKEVNPNLRVFRMPVNAGAAKARLRGVQESPHEWFCLLDADDLLEEGALEEAYSLTAPDVDACLFELWRFVDIDKAWLDSANQQQSEVSGLQAFELTLGSWDTHGFGIYRKSAFLQANQLLTVQAFNADEILTRILFRSARKVRSCKGRYLYRLNDQSITRSFNRKFPGILQSHRWLLENARHAEIRRYRRVAKQAMKDCYHLCRKLDQYDQSWVKAEIDNFLKYLKTDKRAICAIISNIKYGFLLIYVLAKHYLFNGR